MIKQVSKKALGVLALFVAILVSGTSLLAQNRPVRGTVVDEEGAPVIGAAVVLVGNSSVGTMTNVDGAFQLNVPANASLEVSCIGFAKQVVSVGNLPELRIVLSADSEFLEETVVIGYGVQKKSDLTGAVASLRAEDLKNASTTDAAAALQGKVSGVHILNDGAPGSGSVIRVRGYSSNSGNISPLLIVDGLQVSSIQYLDPSLIESMEVLKDAASAAIYGAEAGNGVILITTKSGTTGRTSVSYTGKATLQNFHRRVMLDRAGLLEYLTAQEGADWVKSRVDAFDYSHPDYEGGVIDQDWMSAYIEPSWSQQHSVSFSGGNNAGHFFASLNYVNNDGVVKGDKDVYKRLTAQVNADYQLFKWLQVGTNTSIEKWSTKSVSQRGYSSSFESMMLMDPLTPVYWKSVDEMSASVKNMYKEVEAGTADLPYRFLGDENGFFANTKYSDAEGSPFAKRDGTDGTNGGFNINGTAFLNFTPVKGLTFTSRLGYRLAMSSSHSYTALFWIGDRGSTTQYSISASANTSWYYQWENFANYILNIKKHSITAMAGMSYRENNSDNVSGSASGADILTAYDPQFQYLNYVLGDAAKKIGNAPSKSASLAYFGRLIYSYDNRYSIQGNFRADAFDSSKLSPENRWGFFPSVSAGWTISNEAFVKDNVSRDILSFLKLRASWGLNGNVSVLSGYKYDSTVSVGNNWYQYNVDQAGSTFSTAPNGIANPKLTWETSKQLDLGLDARFFNNKLTLGVDFYDKRTVDLLFNKPLPPELGHSSVTINGGSVLNRGLELELGWKDTIGDFSYSVNANFASLKNEVLSLPADTPRTISTDASSTNFPIQTVFEPGYPIWYIRGFEYAGEINSEGRAVPVNRDGSKDADGNPTYDAGDMTYIGSGIPTSSFGLNINLAWKGIDLMIYGAGAAGHSILPVLHRTGFKNHMKVYYDKWKDGSYPSPSATVGNYQFWSSTANLFKGDYFRIKQLQLGYTIPQKITKKVAINNLRVYVSLDDFFTFTSYPGLDPETASTNNTSGAGLDWGSYPTMQKALFGVNITF